MTFIDQTYLPLKVINIGGSGKRTFDPDGKRRSTASTSVPYVAISLGIISGPSEPIKIMGSNLP